MAEDLDFLGLQGMLDPPRPEAIRAVAACQATGITVKMSTGDHLETARAIARAMGIGRPAIEGAGPTEAIDGRQLAALAPDAMANCVARVDVFARVAPAQKLQLVQALQANGEVVAMTGDGVNDAPALKQADIGIAMGAGGTEVARQAADMLLTDDNFATIEAAVEEGRTVYLNLRKTLAFVLPVNGGASMTILLGAVLGTPLPITALQVLWLNMICSLTMSIALAFEPIVPQLMQQPPRPPRQPLLTAGLVRRGGGGVAVQLGGDLRIVPLEHGTRRRTGPGAHHGRSGTGHGPSGLSGEHQPAEQGSARRLGWGSFTRAPAVPLGLGATVAVQWFFSQTAAMNGFFGTAPLRLERLGVCALPMLLMLPVAWLGERLDPTGPPRIQTRKNPRS